ncbi:MAG: glucan biosynthesis protein [Pseudomonadota bacterium]
MDQIGIAPLTSMYFFGPERRAGVDDFRDAVHDSDGLQMVTGEGQRIWRPLANPRQPQFSAFQDVGPKGFGLTQRRRDFSHFQDDEARYDLRPSAWVEPLADWGEGAVVLVEIPVADEFNDNIVAFWRPKAPLRRSKTGREFAYRLHWSAAPPDRGSLARVVATRSGRSIHDGDRRAMIVDFRKDGPWPKDLEVEAWTSRGELSAIACRSLPETGVMRASFEFAPGDADLVEFQLRLVEDSRPLTETWLYRWTPR